jgi:hypothetical protein
LDLPSWTSVFAAALLLIIGSRRPPRTASVSNGPYPWEVLEKWRTPGYTMCLCGAGRRYAKRHIHRKIVGTRRQLRFELAVRCWQCREFIPIAGLEDVIEHDDDTVHYQFAWNLTDRGEYTREKGPGNPLYKDGYLDEDAT